MIPPIPGHPLRTAYNPLAEVRPGPDAHITARHLAELILPPEHQSTDADGDVRFARVKAAPFLQALILHTVYYHGVLEQPSLSQVRHLLTTDPDELTDLLTTTRDDEHGPHGFIAEIAADHQARPAEERAVIIAQIDQALKIYAPAS